MSTQHTPGPWSVIGSTVYGNGLRSVLPANGADARLMAAAPDLLTALIDAADVLLIHCPDAWALVQARKAIAQAIGVQS
jgi:hypothetical protein